jgi:protocatechuate 3,4-dioxygenase beta subunit
VTMRALSRRDALLGLVGLGIGAAVAGCSSGTDASAPGGSADGPTTSVPSTTSPAAGTTSRTAGTAPPAAAGCTVTPEQTEGPYYLNLDEVRRDITEGRPGAPLRLDLQVLHADGCTPVPHAAIDIWHCDAAGRYSGVDNSLGSPGAPPQTVLSGTFLRGTQVTDERGACSFSTIVPGWYPGRAVHIHVKVHPDPRSEVVSQLYFDDAFLDTLFTHAPYDAHEGARTPNAKDAIFSGGASPPPLTPVATGDGYQASFTFTIASPRS